jgi:hypothetical protein
MLTLSLRFLCERFGSMSRDLSRPGSIDKAFRAALTARLAQWILPFVIVFPQPGQR